MRVCGGVCVCDWQHHIPVGPGRLECYPATYRDIRLGTVQRCRTQVHSTTPQTLPRETHTHTHSLETVEHGMHRLHAVGPTPMLSLRIIQTPHS